MATKSRNAKGSKSRAPKGKAKATPADDTTALDSAKPATDENGFPVTYEDPTPAETPSPAQDGPEIQPEPSPDSPPIGDQTASSVESNPEPETFELGGPEPTVPTDPTLGPTSEQPAAEPQPETEQNAAPFDVTAAEGLNLHLLVYDIPSKADVYNPSWFLRARGFRVNLSCWVIPAARIPYTELAELTEAKVRWRVFKFDAGEAPALVAEALRVLRAEVAEAVARARDNAAKMHAKHLEGAYDAEPAEGEEPRTPADRLEYYEAATERIVGRMEEYLKDIETAINGFGIAPDAVGLNGARAAVETLQTRMNAKAAAYKAAMEALKAAGQTELAAQGREAELPGYAVNDALQEAGVDPEEAARIGNAVDNAGVADLAPSVPDMPAA